jgi:hypothetical protein
LVFLCCPARNYPTREFEGGPNPSTDPPPKISRKKLFPTSTLPENRKGRKRRTTNNEEEGEEEEALPTRNQKSEQSRSREKER